MKNTLLVLFALFFCGAASATERHPVVIKATLTTPSLPCDVYTGENGGDGDGYMGSWYYGAPCQRASQNPFNPSCWQEPEDSCFNMLDIGMLTEPGYCPSQPCELELAFTIQFVEACDEEPCDSPKCCASGTMKVTSGGTWLGGIIGDGDSLESSALDDCACSELQSHHCELWVQVACKELGAYYYSMVDFGRAWRCLACE